jgi:cytochrome c oxidase assembly protein subunit 15
MNPQPLYDLRPLAAMAVLALLLAAVPLVWVGLRHRRGEAAAWLPALTLVTLFLTFDLVLFGAFTRLTDSGLGCPDWPGCYGNASPLGAHSEILSAQAMLPQGPVTRGKAWVEMIHRYLASGVGILITVLMVATWLAPRERRHAISPWWASATFAWVCLQGAFGALTVTMKLYPAIVTAHLLGGIGLLVLLAAQSEAYEPRPLVLPRPLLRGVLAVFVLCVVQVALGGWVSTNYAVLACSDFPTCQGVWWPTMDFGHGFTLLRALGAGKDGGMLPFAALTAIHWVHRASAALVFIAIALLVWRLLANGAAAHRRWAGALAGVALWQLASGVSNVVLGWPMVAALAHTGGAAALLSVLTVMLVRAHQGRQRPHLTVVKAVHAAAARGPFDTSGRTETPRKAP